MLPLWKTVTFPEFLTDFLCRSSWLTPTWTLKKGTVRSPRDGRNRRQGPRCSEAPGGSLATNGSKMIQGTSAGVSMRDRTATRAQPFRTVRYQKNSVRIVRKIWRHGTIWRIGDQSNYGSKATIGLLIGRSPLRQTFTWNPNCWTHCYKWVLDRNPAEVWTCTHATPAGLSWDLPQQSPASNHEATENYQKIPVEYLRPIYGQITIHNPKGFVITGL